ncbi:hypothetical protein FMO003_24970 [Moritella sp. F3]|nr:hypothetical protein FMO001_18240 [Moritella sp. F1]GIC82216.1 hypothetical protein FMO003_24970 [Moritella sp. F3]
MRFQSVRMLDHCNLNIRTAGGVMSLMYFAEIEHKAKKTTSYKIAGGDFNTNIHRGLLNL